MSEIPSTFFTPLFSTLSLPPSRMRCFITCVQNTAATPKIKPTTYKVEWKMQGNAGPCAIRADVTELCKEGRLKDALVILHDMDQRGIAVEFNTYACLLQACTNIKALEEGREVHAYIVSTGLEQSVYLRSKLVNMYAMCGSLENARHVFDKTSKRNVLLWNSMIRGYARNGFLEDALTLYCEMHRTEMKPDKYTFPIVLKVCANLSALQHGKEIHDYTIRTGFESDLFVGNALITMYAKCGCLDYARNVFDKMSRRDVVSWNAMIGGYAQNGQHEEALRFFHQMEVAGVKPDTVTIASVLPACASLGDLQQGKEIHDYISRTEFLLDVLVGNALVDMYAKCGKMEDAHRVFDRMSERDVVSWNAIIAGYVQNDDCDEALKLFCQMQWACVKPNVITWSTIVAGFAQNGQGVEALKVFRKMLQAGLKLDSVTIASILQACAHLAALQQGKEIHSFVLRNGYALDVLVVNALTAMYAKCGSIEVARRVFDDMSERDVISWNAMIAGYAMHGFGKDALSLFYRMQQVGMKPDQITFISVLSACSHAGLVEEGCQYFNLMSGYYHIKPGVKHYACMVDLLGRAGRLHEAQDFIKKMPLAPNADVWGALLGACRIHCNIGLGERVAEILFDLEPANTGYYVLLSNIYAAAGRWDDVTRVRTMMKEKGLKKTPGYSLIEINNKIHTFLVGDRSHPQSEKIYAMLDTLAGKMKEAGHVPNTDFVLHDVEEEVKEHMLCTHSEKLAIAFGLINTSPGTPIRITKNLRVCGDCHDATKLIAKIVNREIIVRDANRFHHFKNGLCSCGDYW
eukprot:Gb_08062 [translate_table: standard]